MVNCSQLYFVDETIKIFFHTDAFNFGIGAYLFQLDTDDEGTRIVATLSKTLSGAQLNWSTIEKDAYAIYYGLQQWEYLLRDTHFTLRTDNKNLTLLTIERR